MKIFLLLIYIFVYGTKCEYQHTGTTILSKYKYFLHSNKQATGGTYIYEISFREHIKECIRMCDYLSSQCVAFNADKVQKMCYFTNTITGLQDANSGWTCVTKGEVCLFQKITSFLFVSWSKLLVSFFLFFFEKKNETYFEIWCNNTELSCFLQELFISQSLYIQTKCFHFSESLYSNQMFWILTNWSNFFLNILFFSFLRFHSMKKLKNFKWALNFNKNRRYFLK